MSQMELPVDFLPLMQQQWGAQMAEELCASLSATDPSVSVRLNPQKAPVSHLPYERVPWCPNGYYLPLRPAFTFDPLLHAGAYYVQDASSMFLSHIIGQYVSAPVVALDLCAAPGGKSTLLRSCLPQGSLLVSNEPMRQRAQVLAENMIKWGNPYTVVTQNYPADFTPLSNFFDLIVTDVPCSGEGMFRKDEQAIRDWSLQNVDLCWRRQRDILQSIWPTLKPGGLLVYSTCTFNRFEDEDNVQWIASHLGAEVLSVPVQTHWNICGEYHFLPGRIRGEGQFMAVLRKDAGNGNAQPYNARPFKMSPAKSEPKALRQWVGDGFSFFMEKDEYQAFPAEYMPQLAALRSGLNVLASGVRLAVMKGKDWQPSHSLAMSTSCCKDCFPVAEISYEQALAYLRHESLQIDAPKGYVLLSYANQPLGFVKNIGNRANNLYPAEWRIRSGYTTPYTLFFQEI